ncbi:PPE domain-containing protein [Rhodococcus kronopolitis]|uniref:PPE domain-containing protein n=1 Tax=Rhodococcus kronopolitis TaxID=1460226 RepID=A0ABV9FZF7_9NOCA
MSLGFTGVLWLPRGATANSTALNAGVGPTALTAASTAWAALSAGLADAAATMTTVLAELAAGWEGVAADAALARLVPFQVWTQEASAMAAATAGRAAAEAAAHTVARLAMPSLAEIAAVKTAKLVAHTVGGSLAGAGAAAEAADRAMDVRAGLVMEAYEAASTAAATPQTFTPPPPLAHGPKAAAADDPVPAPPGGGIGDFRTNPAATAVTAVSALSQHPAVAGAASQAGSIAGPGLGVATSLAPSAVAALTGGVGPAAGGAASGRDGLAARPTSSAARGEGGAQPGFRGPGTMPIRATGSAGVGGSTGATAYFGGPDLVGDLAGHTAAGRGGGSVSGSAGGGGAGPVGGHSGDGAGGRDVPPVHDAARADAASAARGGLLGAPMTGGARGPGSADGEHAVPDYLRGFEHFADGRVVIPSVIGADPDTLS